MNRKGWLVAALFIGIATSPARAEEILALFPLAMEHTAHEVLPQFEKLTGHKVTVQYGTAGAVAEKIRAGEAAAVIISTDAQIDSLTKEGKLVSGSKAELAKVGVGMLVRKGAPRPDISTVDRFKTALLTSKGIAYTDPALGGPVGIYVGKLLGQLGIGEAIKSNTKLSGAGAAVSTTVVNGEAEFGFITINEILADQRVDLVGPLPASIQFYTPFSIGIVASARQRDAAAALVKMMSSAATREAMLRGGFEPF